MKITLSSRRHHYVARASILLIAVALIAGMVGCNGVEYDLTIASTAGGAVSTPGEGTHTYDEGTVVNLVAEAEEGYYFVNWTGDVGTIADVNDATTTITMNGDYDITANFEEEAVTFADPNLEAAIREAIDIPEGPIYPSDLEGLTLLDALERNITDLTGLEYFTNLRHLNLNNNQISDISPLVNLTNLTRLGLTGNQISDISPLANLTNLTCLWLPDNQISDISPLVNLTSLTEFHLQQNPISDIAPLANLTNLTDLYLSSNQISDISPLVDNEGLSTGDRVYLTGNPLSWDSINIYIPQLEARGVTANFEEEAVTFADPNLEAAIRQDMGKPTGPIYPSDLEGLGFLWANDENIADLTGLEQCTNLNSLYLYNNQISDISPLASLTNLTHLSLENNQISDISPLASLTNLTLLDLRDNQISDISPLASLTNLTLLDLLDNQISDISPLASLTNLNSLGLRDNQISDVSALVQNAGLGAGDGVDLRGNPLSSDSINIYIPQLQARGVTVHY